MKRVYSFSRGQPLWLSETASFWPGRRSISVGKLHNCLREIRRKANLTQTQLAELAGTSKNTISLIELGAFNPTAFMAAKLCYVLDVEFEDLFGLEIIEEVQLDPADYAF